MRAILITWLLITTLLVQVRHLHPAGRSWPVRIVLALVGLGICLAPVGALRLADLVGSVIPSLSLPLMAVLLHLGVGNQGLLRQRDLRILGWWGTSGLLFYAMMLGMTPFDPYDWGWRPLGMLAATGIASVLLIWQGSRVGVVLVAAVLAFALRGWESANLWDYLMDPLLVLLGPCLLVHQAVNKHQRKQACGSSVRTCEAADLTH